MTHLTNLITDLPTLGQIALTGIVGTPVAIFDGVSQAIQNVSQAIAANDPAGVLTAILAAPGVFLDEALNATGGTTPGTAQGLLSNAVTSGNPLSNGPIGAVLQIRNTIATALDGPSSSSQASSSSSSQVAAEATPTTAANTVTLNVAATPASSTPVTPKTSTTPVTPKTTTTPVTPRTPTTPTVPAATTGTSGINVSPTSTPGSHPTTMKTVIGQLNSTVNTVGGLGATHHGGKTTKK